MKVIRLSGDKNKLPDERAVLILDREVEYGSMIPDCCIMNLSGKIVWEHYGEVCITDECFHTENILIYVPIYVDGKTRRKVLRLK